jgi:hypothetical protein
MNWTELLTSEIEDTYKATFGLLEHVDDDKLDWKPATGENWMTMGQLLKHLPTACGFCIKGFATGDWGPMPENPEANDMIPPADALPSATSVAETRTELEADKQVALAMLAEAGEEALASKGCPAPWDPSPMILGRRALQMVGHLAQHKGQLFYYLKLQGKPVNTAHLWGM